MSASGQGAHSRWAALRWFDEVGELHLLGLIRVLFGLLFSISLTHEVRQLVTGGFFADVFHLPFFSERWVPSRELYIALLAVKGLLIGSILLGRFSRVSLLAMVGVDGYLLLADRLSFHNNRYAILCFAFLLSFAPCDRTLCWPARGGAPAVVGPLWAQRLMQLQMSLIYLASSGSKLLDIDWRGGDVMSVRFARGATEAPQMFRAFAIWMSNPLRSEMISKAAIATEIFLALGLWSRRWRPWALWVGALFHLTIEVTANVQLFSWLTLSVYVLFAEPTTRERSLIVLEGSREAAFTAWCVRHLDWLARFRIETTGVAPVAGAKLAIRRTNGEVVTGPRAFSTLCACLPVLVPLWGVAKSVAWLSTKMSRNDSLSRTNRTLDNERTSRIWLDFIDKSLPWARSFQHEHVCVVSPVSSTSPRVSDGVGGGVFG